MDESRLTIQQSNEEEELKRSNTIWIEEDEQQEQKHLIDDSRLIQEDSTEQLIDVRKKTARINKNDRELPSTGNDIDEMAGEIPAGAHYISFNDKKYLIKHKSDSTRMKNVREALARFHDVEENGGNAAKALDDLIKACDKYSFGRFRIFKRGRGRQRLDEVLEIRRRAEEVKAEKYSGTKYIHTDTSNEDFEKKKEEIKKRGTGKIIAAGLGMLFGFTIGNIAKLLTLNPLWDKRGFNWTPGHYFRESMDFLDRTFGRTIEKEVEEPEIVNGEKTGKVVKRTVKERVFDTKTSQSAKDKSETFAEEKKIEAGYKKWAETGVDPDYDEELYLDQGYDNNAALMDVKRRLIEAYKKQTPDLEEIAFLEGEVKEGTETAEEFVHYMQEKERKKAAEEFVRRMDEKGEMKSEEELADYMNKLKFEFNMDAHKPLDEELQRSKAEFTHSQELKTQALKNTGAVMTVPELIRLDKRDEAYDEEKVKEALDEFEKLDLKSISFSSVEDMLRDYGKNMQIFSRIHAIHYMLFRGINHGFKLENETLIRLRAKFKAAYEMRSYMTKANEMAIKKPGALTDQNVWVNERKGVNDNSLTRVFAEPGDVKGLLARCEEQIRKEYEERVDKIKAVYGFTEADNAEEIPGSRLLTKAEAYESNALVYDFMEYRINQTREISYMSRVKAYNADKEEEQRIPEMQVPRIHETFLCGRSMEDLKRLTDLYYGSAEERLDYYRECIREIKSISLKEWDIHDPKSFYDNYGRKNRVLDLCTNAKELKEGVIEALQELLQEEREKNPEISKNSRPKLTEEFKKEFGYASLEEFMLDMDTTQNFANELQGKFDTIATVKNKGFLPYWSLEELCSMDEKQVKVIQDKGMKMYMGEFEAEATEATLWFTSFHGGVNNMLTAILTKPLSKKDISKGKLLPVLNKEVDVAELFEEEKKNAHWTELAIKRNGVNREKETLAAQQNIEKVDGIYQSKVEMVEPTLTDHRHITGYAGAMSYLCEDTGEKTQERVKAFSVPLDKATKEEKAALAQELEDAFSLILSFDINELNFDDYMDFAQDEKVRARVMAKLCFDFGNLFNRYEKLIDDPEAIVRLNKKELEEVRIKKDFLMEVNRSVDTLLNCVKDKSFHKTEDTFRMLTWTEHQFEDDMPSKSQSAMNLYTVKFNTIEPLGLYPGADMEIVYEKYREKAGMDAKDHGKEILKKLESAKENKK